MKKIFSLLVVALATMTLSAQTFKVTWNLDGGCANPMCANDKDELYSALNADVNAFYGWTADWGKVSTFTAVTEGMPSKAGKFDLTFFADPAMKNKWGWLLDYCDATCASQKVGADGKDLVAPSSNASYMRYNINAFFTNLVRASWPVSADYKDCGVDATDKWMAAWKYTYNYPEEVAASYILPTPIKKGYTFLGWFNGENKVEAISADTALTAKYEAIQYKVTWDLNGGVSSLLKGLDKDALYSALNADVNAFYGWTADWGKVSTFTAVTEGMPSKAGKFDLTFFADPAMKNKWGWLLDYCDATCASQKVGADGKDLVAPSSNASYMRYNINAFFTNLVRASWPVSADYKDCGVDSEGWKSYLELPATVTIDQTLPTPYMLEYNFLGWYNGDTKIEHVDADMTLTAKWERAIYNVTFVAPFAYPNPLFAGNKDMMYAELNADYNTFYGVETDWGVLSTFTAVTEGMPSKGGKLDLTFFADSMVVDGAKTLNPMSVKWGWLLEYCDSICARQKVGADGKDLVLPSTNASYARYNVNAFFTNLVRASWPVSADYKDCGVDAKDQEWKKFWGYDFVMPDTIVEDYTLPVMYRKNYEFKGWYWSEDFSGDEVKVVPVKTNGSVYAKFEATDKALLGIALDKKDTVELQMPATDQLTVIYTPETAVNKKVVWSSSDENVLVVDQNGLVTPMAPGKATIKVVSDESKLEASVVYNITAAPGAVTGVTLDQTKVTLDMGKTIQLVATIAPDTAINKKVIWTSDGKAASVDENGLVKADTIGTATITVTTEDGGYTATCVVTVPEPLDDIVVEKLWEVAIPSTVANIGDVRNGMGWNGKFYLTDKKQNKIRVFSQAGEDADAAIPMAEGANLGTGIAIDDAGNIIVNANFPSADTCVYIVKNGETKMTKIDFASMGGRCDHITAFGDVFSEEGGLVFFYAQNKGPQYVKISKGEFVKKDTIKGTFTHSSQGQAQIIYGTETECIASQRGSFEHMVDGILVPHDAKNIVLNDVGGAVMNIGGENVWAYKVGNNGGKAHSSEFSIRNVTTHRFVADKNGETVQYVIDNKQDASGNSCGIFAKAEKINEYAYYLNVFSSPKGAAVYKVYKNVPVESIVLDKTAETVKAGDKLQLTATITPAYATVQDVEWSTSDSAVAIVDQNGLVQAVSAGEATITATTKDGNHTATCTLTVKAVLYKKATSAEQLIAGKKMLIVNGDSITMAEARTNNFGSVAVTPNEDGVIDNVPAEATVITLEKDSVFSFAIDGGYITATTAGSNYLRVDKERTSLTGWDITIAENGAAGIVCHDPESERNTIRFNKNNGNPIFSAYKAENKMEDVAIYIEFEPVTYNVTVPAGTNMCYIVGAMTDSWTQFVEMEMVDATHYTITLDNAAKTDEYKYTCGPDWKYVEKNADGSERGNRTWAEQDVVEAWAEIYNAVEDIHIDANTIEKVIIDGNLYIIRGGKLYNANGAVVR